MKRLIFVSAASLVMLLAACSKGEQYRLGPQQWNDVQVLVETRPSPVQAGMNEFLVIASRGRQPEHNLVVSLRLSDSDPWKQCIQDGHVGVYRRALKVDDPQTALLGVQIQRGNQQGVLHFPLKTQSSEAK